VSITPNAQRLVLLGRIAGAFGVHGEVRIESWTQPRAAIFNYQPWLMRRPNGEDYWLDHIQGRQQGQQLIVHLPQVNERTQAQALYGSEIYVPRNALPPPEPGQYYWVDLEGLSVQTVDGVPLGKVSHLFATGSNDVLVVQGERERLLPFLEDEVIRSIDFAAGMMVVDWDPDF